MKQIISKIIDKESLTFKEAKNIIYAIAEDELNASQIAAILVGIQMRGLQLEEIKGFRSALLELTIPVDIDGSNAIDLCGTGGDGKNTFNISTTTAFVVSAMGYKVIKHGNYGVSSTCGSSNVLEELGYQFTTDSIKLNQQLKEKNICFLHAPLFHPTLLKVGSIRKELGIRTFFNALGPLVNPVQPEYQLTGTYNLELAKIYQHILQGDRTEYRVVFGMNGYDELTLTDQTRVLGSKDDDYINASLFNQSIIDPASIHSGDTIQEAAKILKAITRGEGTKPQNNVISANVSLVLQCFHPSKPLKELFNEALEFIE
ncbi:anthranilate phosphoribosyltransferase, partial [Crocinitomicaceae bacterium]|nr:anthranilate phosphoribosyltransferase [Crocinitomicaceae bacterium]